ncbi:MAG: hypothetical protein E6713_13850 [Sporomusaceae bacterium]|nr:hypothetical protein [Sporomusaceae bacterium]
MDMPVMMVEVAQPTKAWDMSTKFSDIAKMMGKLREVWDHQTLDGLETGKIVVADEWSNEILRKAIADSPKIKEFQMTSLGDNKMKLHLVSEESGTVELVCKIHQLEHDKDHSILKIEVLSKSMPDRPILSFMASFMSMAMVAKLAGVSAVNPDMNITFRGNDITVDFHQAILHSPLADIEVMGYRLLDYLVISGVKNQAGAMELQTNLTVPHQVIEVLKNVL